MTGLHYVTPDARATLPGVERIYVETFTPDYRPLQRIVFAS